MSTFELCTIGGISFSSLVLFFVLVYAVYLFIKDGEKDTAMIVTAVACTLFFFSSFLYFSTILYRELNVNSSNNISHICVSHGDGTYDCIVTLDTGDSY